MERGRVVGDGEYRGMNENIMAVTQNLMNIGHGIALSNNDPLVA